MFPLSLQFTFKTSGPPTIPYKQQEFSKVPSISSSYGSSQSLTSISPEPTNTSVLQRPQFLLLGFQEHLAEHYLIHFKAGQGRAGQQCVCVGGGKVTQTGLEFVILLHQPPNCWDYSCAPPFLANKFLLKFNLLLIIKITPSFPLKPPKSYWNMPEIFLNCFDIPYNPVLLQKKCC